MKKNDKIIILIGLGLLFTMLTWFIATGSYANGNFMSSGINRAGIFDYILFVYYSLYYRASDIFYLFVLGGTYGVLSKTNMYRKLVSKTVSFIKDREVLAMLIVTFVIGAFTSLTNLVLPMLVFVPFIITVFLKRGKDRLTAINASFGGIFIGLIGQTFGTYGMTEMIDATEIGINEFMGTKIIIFLVAYVLYNLFAILHMRKQNEVINEVSYDNFATTKIDESVKKRKTKIWPLVIVFIITTLITVLAHINWNTSFEVTFFDEFFNDLMAFEIADVDIFRSLLGSVSAFGAWTDMLPFSFVLIIVSIIVALCSKEVKFSDFFSFFGEGMAKMSKVAFVYILVMSLFITTYYFDFPLTIINALFGIGDFNVFKLLVIGFMASLLFIDGNYVASLIGNYLTIMFASNLALSVLLIRLGGSLVTVVAPTSFILMIALTYLDVPYSKWLKYIWRFLLSIFVAVVIVMAIASRF